MGVFSATNAPVGGIKRSTFDLSFQNNLTLKFGTLYPCFCKEVLAGDSWHIDPSFGLRFLPTYFPLQTKINAKLDFFYVRNRNLWDGFKNYLYMTGQPDEFPVLSSQEAMFQSQTGSLGDYLGLPSTVIGSESHQVYSEFVDSKDSGVLSVFSTINSPSSLIYRTNTSVSGFSYISSPISFSDMDLSLTAAADGVPDSYDTGISLTKYVRLPYDISSSLASHLSIYNFKSIVGPSLTFFVNYDTQTETSFYRYSLPTGVPAPGARLIFYYPDNGYFYVSTTYYDGTGYASPSSFRLLLSSSSGNGTNPSIYAFELVPLASVNPIDFSTQQEFSVSDYNGSIPYDISALPFRAYEQIYNAFYRDNRNNPFLVNGVYDPNVFIPNSKGGIDSYQYRLHQRNWEQDFLTSAMPTPQYGNAPLVGITSTGVATVALDDGTTVDSQLVTGPDGDTVVSFASTSSPEANRTLVALASSGISINDFRGVNALQRFLETSLRRGLRYKDQVLAHTGVTVNYDTLDMPEFIGSVSQRIDVSQINQTSQSTSGDPLGSYAGQLSCVGGAQKMSKYCDENGYIIGILSVVPVPCYSQLVPKHFLKTKDPLDYYDEAFANLGLQPIRYEEVCPLQVASFGSPQDVNKVFGYQRAWYDYMSSVDEVHGDFRTTLNHFTLQRVFNFLPSLNADFLTVQPDQLNEIFSISSVPDPSDSSKTTLIDTILGQVHFDVSCERRIPRYAIPSLE